MMRCHEQFLKPSNPEYIIIQWMLLGSVCNGFSAIVLKSECETNKCPQHANIITSDKTNWDTTRWSRYSQ